MSKSNLKQIRQTYARMAKGYDWAEGYILNTLGLRRWRRAMLKKAQGHVLEVGVGTGLGFKDYPKAVKSITALDLSPEMLALAAPRAKAVGASLTCGDTGHLPFKDSTFDTVVDCLCLCTYPNPQRALAEMHRVLKPGGQIVLIEHGLSKYKWLQKLQHKYAQNHFKKTCCNWHLDMDEVVESNRFFISDAKRRFAGLIYLFKIIKK